MQAQSIYSVGQNEQTALQQRPSRRSWKGITQPTFRNSKREKDGEFTSPAQPHNLHAKAFAVN
jgi:hypothetical protein